MFCFVFLLYFDLRRPALLVVAVYAILNGGCTFLFVHVGEGYYGYGSLIAAVITFLVAFSVLLRELPWLHYHAFVTNNTSLQRSTKGIDYPYQWVDDFAQDKTFLIFH